VLLAFRSLVVEINSIQSLTRPADRDRRGGLFITQVRRHGGDLALLADHQVFR